MKHSLLFLIILILSVFLYGCKSQEQNKIPPWYDKGFIKKMWKEMGENEEIKVLIDGKAIHNYYISLADITDDGIPECFFGYDGIMGHARIFYTVFSFSDKDWVRGDDGELALVVAPPKNDLFNDEYYVDESGKKYYLSIVPGGNATYFDYTVTKVWYENEAVKFDAWNVPRDEFIFPEEIEYLQVVKRNVYSRDSYIEFNTFQSMLMNAIVEYLEI